MKQTHANSKSIPWNPNMCCFFPTPPVIRVVVVFRQILESFRVVLRGSKKSRRFQNASLMTFKKNKQLEPAARPKKSKKTTFFKKNSKKNKKTSLRVHNFDKLFIKKLIKIFDDFEGAVVFGAIGLFCEQFQNFQIKFHFV